MGKKIKISEDQLMRLMENKGKQINEDETMNEIGLGAIETGLAKMVAPMIIHKMREQGEDMSVVNMGIFTRALEHELNQHMRNLDEESSMGDDEMDLETGGAEDLDFPESEMQADEMMNESVKEYKSEFNRFMKGPKI